MHSVSLHCRKFWRPSRLWRKCRQDYSIRDVFCRGVARGGSGGSSTPFVMPTSYERSLATHVVTLASCKLEFTVLELVVATIYHAAHINQQHGFTLASFRARGKDRTLRKDQVTY